MHRSLTTSSLLLAISAGGGLRGIPGRPLDGPGDSRGPPATPKATAPAPTATPAATPTASAAPSTSVAPSSSAVPRARHNRRHPDPGGRTRARMTIPRLVTHAILLGDGRVLVVGNDGG